MRHCLKITSVLFVAVLIPLSGCSNLQTQLGAIPQGKHKDMTTLKNIARLQERQGKLWKARQMYQELHRNDPSDPHACHRLAIVSARLGDHKNAMQFFAKARQLAPRDVDLLNDYGYELYLQDQLPGAERMLKQAIQVDPGNKRALNNLAMVLGHQGRIEESYALFRRVVGEAEANANIAFVHVQRGEGNKAAQHYSRSLSLDDSLKTSSQGLVQLAEIKKRGLHSRSLNPAKHQPAIAEEKAGKAELASIEDPREQIETLSPSWEQELSFAPELIEETPVDVVEADAFLPEEQLSDFAQPGLSEVEPQARTVRRQMEHKLAKLESEVEELLVKEPQQQAAALPAISPRPAPEPLKVNPSTKLSKRAPKANDRWLATRKMLSKAKSRSINAFGAAKKKLRPSKALAALGGNESPTKSLPLQKQPAVPGKTSSESLATTNDANSDDANVDVASVDHAKAADAQVDDANSRSVEAEKPLKQESASLLALCPQAEGEVSKLVESLESADSSALIQSIIKLGNSGMDAVAAVPALMTLMEHDDPSVRIASAFSIWQIEQNTDETIPTVVATLEHSDAGVRWFGAFILKRIGERSETVVSALSHATADDDEFVRLIAAEALQELKVE